METIFRLIKIKPLSIFILWLFQLTAIIGVSIGFKDWFISKTPLNLLITFCLLILNFRIDTVKKIIYSLSIIIISLFVEWVGVKYGFLFGEYKYGHNLGYKIDGVPLLIGVNWLLLLFSTSTIANKWTNNVFLKVIYASVLMVFLDFFIEKSAPPFDFWIWELGYPPLRNFISWFWISIILHFIYHLSKIKGDFVFSCHLYLAQLLFFIYFYGYHCI